MSIPQPTRPTILEEARRERARLREAQRFANEVLERVSGQTAVSGTNRPSAIPEMVSRIAQPPLK